MDTPAPNTTPLTPPPANPHKTMAIVGYIVPILFFIPLLNDAKNDPYAKFHANQQLNLFIYWVAVNVLGMIPVLGWFMLMPIGIVIGIVLAIMGIMNAANGTMKELPLIGKFSLIK